MDYAKLIFDIARSDGMPVNLANFIVAQAKHETAENGVPFKSHVFLSCKNAFGYKYVGQKLAIGPCTASPESDYYAAYGSVDDSVHELTAWIFRRQKQNKFPEDLNSITTASQYALLLKNCGYFTDNLTTYTNGLIKFAVKFGDYMAFGGVLVLGVAAWFLSKK